MVNGGSDINTGDVEQTLQALVAAAPGASGSKNPYTTFITSAEELEQAYRTTETQDTKKPFQVGFTGDSYKRARDSGVVLRYGDLRGTTGDFSQIPYDAASQGYNVAMGRDGISVLGVARDLFGAPLDLINALLKNISGGNREKDIGNAKDWNKTYEEELDAINGSYNKRYQYKRPSGNQGLSNSAIEKQFKAYMDQFSKDILTKDDLEKILEASGGKQAPESHADQEAEKQNVPPENDQKSQERENGSSREPSNQYPETGTRNGKKESGTYNGRTDIVSTTLPLDVESYFDLFGSPTEWAAKESKSIAMITDNIIRALEASSKKPNYIVINPAYSSSDKPRTEYTEKNKKSKGKGKFDIRSHDIYNHI